MKAFSDGDHERYGSRDLPLATPIVIERYYDPDRAAMAAALRVVRGPSARPWTETEPAP